MITQQERERLRGWFTGRLPDGVYEELLDVTVDREEITVVGRLPEPRFSDDVSPEEREAAAEGRINEFRERTRGDRMAVAREAERRFDRKVSWGARCGDLEVVFTNVSAPVMTRLRQPERQVLDVLIAGGVARSRSEALAWCVRQVHDNASAWFSDLRESLEHVRRVRDRGPHATGASARADDS